jgi:hypothetical protein
VVLRAATNRIEDPLPLIPKLFGNIGLIGSPVGRRVGPAVERGCIRRQPNNCTGNVRVLSLYATGVVVRCAIHRNASVHSYGAAASNR